MSHPIKIAEFDLSVFTGVSTQLIMTAEESEQGYDYTVAAYIGDLDNILVSCIYQKHFHDQETADEAVKHMKHLMLELIQR